MSSRRSRIDIGQAAEDESPAAKRRKKGKASKPCFRYYFCPHIISRRLTCCCIPQTQHSRPPRKRPQERQILLSPPSSSMTHQGRRQVRDRCQLRLDLSARGPESEISLSIAAATLGVAELNGGADTTAAASDQPSSMSGLVDYGWDSLACCSRSQSSPDVSMSREDHSPSDRARTGVHPAVCSHDDSSEDEHSEHGATDGRLAADEPTAPQSVQNAAARAAAASETAAGPAAPTADMSIDAEVIHA